MTLCEKTLRAAEILPLELSMLNDEELAFAEHLLAQIWENARRLRGMAEFMPKVRL